MIPLCAYSVLLPSIVWVFPVPVWPYAKIVPLYPSRTLSMIGNAACLKIFSCKQVG